MPPFRRVDARQAGPRALGILVPPGLRTVVILRPRSLEWDLLPLKPGLEQSNPPAFCDWTRDEAAVMARRVVRAFERVAGSLASPIEIVCSPPGERYGVCARVEGCLWIACGRLAGKSYQPSFFGCAEEAAAAAALLAPLLSPAADAQQEYYFNTQAFARG